MTKERIDILLHALDIAEMDMSITVSGVQLYTSAEVYAEMWRYFDYVFYDVIDPEAGHGVVYNDYKAAWSMWIAMHGSDLKRQYDAAAAVYDPLHNYDMVEQGADGERTGTQTTTITPHGKITQTAEESGTYTDTSRAYKSGVDSTGDGVQTDKIESTHTPTNHKTTTETIYAAGTDSQTAVTHTHDQTATADGHTITGADRAQEHYLTRSGNIGVTTSQQMLLSEIQLREQLRLLETFVHQFVSKYCIYVGGVD